MLPYLLAAWRLSWDYGTKWLGVGGTEGVNKSQPKKRDKRVKTANLLPLKIPSPD